MHFISVLLASQKESLKQQNYHRKNKMQIVSFWSNRVLKKNHRKKHTNRCFISFWNTRVLKKNAFTNCLFSFVHYYIDMQRWSESVKGGQLVP